MADKKKGKGGKKIRVVTRAGAPVFKYLCTCHNVPATKTPCTVPAGVHIKESIVEFHDGEKVGAAPKGEATLGSWRCSTSNKPTKVTRVKNVAETTPAVEVAHG